MNSPIVGGVQMGHSHLDPKNHASKGTENTFDGKSMKLGGGGRFAKLKSELASKGASNPGALAGFIGRKKYGAKKMGSMSAKGREE